MEGDTFKTNSNKIVSHQNVYKSIIYTIGLETWKEIHLRLIVIK